MNIELTRIAEKKIEQMGGTPCGVLVCNEAGALACVSEHGRVTWLDDSVMGPSGAQPDQLSAGVVPECTIKTLSDHLNELSQCEEGDRDYALEEHLDRALQSLTAAPTAQAVQGGGVPDYVWEALQRLIENGGQCGPASREDALVVAKHRHALLTHPHNGEQGGEWVRWSGDSAPVCGETIVDVRKRWVTGEFRGPAKIFNWDLGADPHAEDVIAYRVFARPQPPKSKEDRGHE